MTPLNEQAYLHLQNLIITDQLSYQEVYSETQLSKELNISRTPFRDAVHRLAQEGYIDIIPSKGFMLHRLTEKDVIETFQVRSALECYCTREIAADHENEKAKKLCGELYEITDKMTEIMNTTRSIEEFCKYDFDFHTKVIRYPENDQFISIFGTFMYRMRRLAGLSLAHEGRMETTCREHRDIVDAMAAGDKDHVCEVTRRHMLTPQAINLEDLKILGTG